MTPLQDRFLRAVQEAYQAYVETHSRSNKKLRVLHGWVIRELKQVLGNAYTIQGLSTEGGEEKKAKGRYYTKSVDVAISRGDTMLGVVSIKFVMTNYRQNKNNYFEQQLGETANLRNENIAFGHILLRLHPTPYLKKGGAVGKMEAVDNHAIELYAKLVEDHGQPHIPDAQCLAIFMLDQHKGKVLRQCRKEDLPEVSDENFRKLETKLGVDHFFQMIKGAVEQKCLAV